MRHALSASQDRPLAGGPGWWCWLREMLLWHLERMPDLFDAAELAGIDPARVDWHHFEHHWNAGARPYR